LALRCDLQTIHVPLCRLLAHNTPSPLFELCLLTCTLEGAERNRSFVLYIICSCFDLPMCSYPYCVHLKQSHSPWKSIICIHIDEFKSKDQENFSPRLHYEQAEATSIEQSSSQAPSPSCSILPPTLYYLPCHIPAPSTPHTQFHPSQPSIPHPSISFPLHTHNLHQSTPPLPNSHHSHPLHTIQNQPPFQLLNPLNPTPFRFYPHTSHPTNQPYTISSSNTTPT
jgi:hypothetical protein